MGRILIGWEFGANRGHALRLARLARLLRDAGHEVGLAIQRIDDLTPEEAHGAAIWQAPVTPRMLSHVARPRTPTPATLGDILARLGGDDPRLVAAIIRAWRTIFAAVRPALVIADYAPFLLLAARGRFPVLHQGTPFQTPPPHLASFPAIAGGTPAADEAATLRAVNEGLGSESVESLPGIFAADRTLTDSFAELDPYAEARSEPLLLPVPADFRAAAGAGEEVFVYAPENSAADAPLWRGLAQSGLPIRVHVPRAAAPLREAIAALRLAFEAEPVPFAEIARRSRLVVSHGGHGFACAALAAGLANIICYPDLEKRFYGLALARHGLGGHVAMAGIEPAAFGASLKRIHADEALAARARAAGPAFLARGQKPFDEALMEAVAELM
jgi:hypothetical protein